MTTRAVLTLAPARTDDQFMITNTWSAAMSAYVLALQAAHRSPGTIRLHRHYLRHAARFAPRPWTATTTLLTRALAVPSWSAETRKSARGALVGFYRWAHLAGIVDVDPSRGLPHVTVPAGQPRPAPEDILSRALATAGPRERTMMLLGAYAGLRAGEIAAVRGSDWSRPLLRVTGKGGKTRIVPIVHPELVTALEAGDGPLFPGQVDGHLAAGTVTKLLSNALPGRWTAHTLRHRFATRSNAAHPDLLALGRVLGHSRPETTQRYVLLSQDALLAVVRAAA